MTKKILYGMMAAIMLFATSCEKEPELGGNAGQKSVVSFNIGTPEIATRAYSDGTTATVLQYAVYDAEGNILNALTETDATINGSTTVNLQLTTGNTYSVIFWAAAPNATNAPNAPYSVDFANKTMIVDYTNAVSNDENRDAFYKYHTFTVTGAQTETIELKRPFAQLNIGTNDYAASTSAGYTPTKSAVTVENIYSTLDLVEGKVSNEVAAEFALANIKKDDLDETFPVAGNEYLAMNYLLVGKDKETVEVEFTYTDGSNAKTRTVGSVPVQRNYRTNIYGQLLTSDVKVNVEIEPDYDGSHAADDLMLAAAVGGEVTLTKDVELDKPLDVQANMVINLNGYTIRAKFAKGDGAVVEIAEGVSAKLIGGTIKNLTKNGDAAINNAGNLVLSNITINGAPIGDTGYPAYAVYTSGKLTVEDGTTIISDRGAVYLNDGADVTINGGDITVTNAVGSRVLTAHVIYAYGNNSKLTINDGNFANNIASTRDAGVSVICPMGATISIYGGNFSFAGVVGQGGCIQNYMGVKAPVIYGGTFSDTTVYKNIAGIQMNIAEGYKATEVNGNYVVIPENATGASTATEVSDAIAAGRDVVLVGDVTYNSNISNDATIDLNGNTFEATNTITLGNNSNLTMTGGNYVVNSTYGHVDVRPSSTEGSVVTYENVDFSYNYLNKTYGPSTNRLGTVVEVCGTATDAKTVIKFKNCKFDNAQILFEGMSGKTSSFEAEFDGCTFNALTSSAPIYVQNYVNGTIKLTNCTFNLECTSSVASAVSVSPSSSTAVTVIAENNTLNATAATPYTFDASKGETEVHNVKVNGTPNNIKFISLMGSTTSSATETGTIKSGIAAL